MKNWITRSAGVLLPLSALPSRRLGEDADRFVDLCADAGFGVWQILPVGPSTHANPFQPASACAGDTTLLPAEPPAFDARAFDAFVERESDWLEDWALFSALRRTHQGAPWWQWAEPLRRAEPAALAAARRRLGALIDAELRAQFAFEQAWSALRRYANARGVRIFGDVPLFVAHDSADVWLHRELFEVDAEGRCGATVGVPPDYFSETGQSWGYPPYRWARIAAQGWRWWRRRFEVQARRFDLLRLDHFRGFAAFWRIPGGAATAAAGRWTPGPGRAAIDALADVLGSTRLVAEDLGEITPDVIALRKALGIPGMRVLQFAFDGNPHNEHLPAHHEPDSVCYTGTHDNDTTLGWWNAAPEDVRRRVRDLLGDDIQMPQALVDCAWASPAPLSIVPLQDLLGLGTEARTNRPGIAEGNWGWRFDWAQLPADAAARWREALRQHGRAV